ncbi:PREDICTED: uncharacterized protein LOC105977807 [Erythranthe guttata]|uniref:uncharacterized protein LOC105977807 n=1 Tax=Erythranthe guttata TaxID=4155 RepID=UPI00064DC6A7|nr:PREDICTED: uncharacterized protein LOC105977807 [Erythranthe guttata]|eukprot:XP_012858642.1 PREDICTED: uncharacterized protein LOC105977807 [Erythranthe guttata]
MTKPTFMCLLETLHARGYLIQSPHARVSVMEEVALFLRTVGMHHRQRDSMERFQHSLETINRHVRRVIKALNMLASEVISPPNFNEVYEKIAANPEFSPFFNDAVGAIDGTLIPAWVPRSKQNAFRSRKAIVSQNVLAICDFDLMFTYVYAGWEGSANDSLVLRNAVANDPSFLFPPPGTKMLKVIFRNFSSLIFVCIINMCILICCRQILSS